MKNTTIKFIIVVGMLYLISYPYSNADIVLVLSWLARRIIKNLN